MSRERRERGFTLIELLVVITILGLLVGFAAVKVFDAIEDGRQTRARADIDAFLSALKYYKLEKKQYPSTAEGLEALQETSAKHPEGYMDNFPEADPWGNPYDYRLDGNKPIITCFGRDGVEGGEGYDEDIRSDNLSGSSETN